MIMHIAVQCGTPATLFGDRNTLCSTQYNAQDTVENMKKYVRRRRLV